MIGIITSRRPACVKRQRSNAASELNAIGITDTGCDAVAKGARWTELAQVHCVVAR